MASILANQTESNPTPSETPAEVSNTPVEPLDFRSHIPGELRNEKVWESVPDFPTLAKNYVDMSKYTVGAIKLPGENATPDEWNRVYDKLGRPETADKYAFQAPEGMELDGPALEKAKQVAHQNGLSQRQYEAMVGVLAESAQSNLSALRAQGEAVVAELKQELGGAFTTKLGYAQRVIQEYFGEEVFQEINRSPLGNNKKFITGLMRLGENMAEDGVLPGANGMTPSQTKESALAQANTLMADKAYTDRRDPRHNQIVAEVERLFGVAYN